MTRIRSRDRRTRPHLLPLLLAVLLLVPPIAAQAGVGENGYPLPDLGTDQIRGEGRIHEIRMAEQEIVIDDSLYRLLPETTYYTSTMGAGSMHLFHPGKTAGYITNPQGEILKLWLLE